MPKATLEEEKQYRFEEETPYPARLLSVEERSFPYTDKNGEAQTFTKWSWKFEITEGEDSGAWAFGDTEPKLTTHPDNKVRMWAEALRGTPFELGEGLETDDLLGLGCILVFAHRSYVDKKSGETRYICDIADVYSADGDISVSQWNSEGEPPF